MREEVSRWVDGLGERVDPGIKDTVVALNLLGIPTVSSCEGHLDHGRTLPWVDIGLPLSPFLARVEVKAYCFIGKVEYKHLRTRSTRVRDGIWKLGKVAARPRYRRALSTIARLVDEFNATRPRTEYTLELMPFGISGFRLMSLALERTPSEQRTQPGWKDTHLSNAQTEMHDFTNFLVRHLA
jgi:hypothetical protein